MTSLTPWLVIAPLAGGAAAFIVSRHSARSIGMFTSVSTMLLTLVVAAQVNQGTPLRILIGGWGAPLGIELYVDGLSAVMLLLTAVCALTIALFSWNYFQYAPAESGRSEWQPYVSFWPLFLFLWGGMNALYLSSDIFNLYVSLELVTLSAVALVVLTESTLSLGAAIRYLLAAFVGSLAFLLGVALLYAAFDTLDLSLLAARVTPGLPAALAIALVTAGLSLKTALFPLHFWLPRAHATAPAPVSALLSALVVTASFYLILRLWLGPFAPAITPPVAQCVGAAGAAAIIWGSIQAIRQQQLKLMIAYSTVAQVGYLFLVLPLATASAGASLAWSGGVYHAIAHAFAKAAMFLAAGTIVYSVGSDRIVGMSGIATRLPVATHAFGLAGLSLIGLPPTGGFVAKWLLLSASLETAQWWWAIVILVGGILTAGYVFLVLGQELSQVDEEVQPDFKPVPRALEYAAMLLALIALGLGLVAPKVLGLLEVGSRAAGGTVQ